MSGKPLPHLRYIGVDPLSVVGVGVVQPNAVITPAHSAYAVLAPRQDVVEKQAEKPKPDKKELSKDAD